jgi:cis-3-alkyl-4-acyloxetan-2-one decarboxylase
MHYVDEGPADGRPVVLVHGNPTWGYLYRHFIPPLVAAGHRVIVPDHLGFGRSRKPADHGLYRVRRHAERLEALLESLELDGAVVVPHDWGGPIGLHWATRHPQRVSGLFVLNTLAHAIRSRRLAPGRGLPVPLRLIRAPLVGELLVQGLDVLKPLVFRMAIERRDRLTPEVRHAYRSVHRSWSDRAGMLVFPRELPSESGSDVDRLNAEIEARLRRDFRDKPVHIAWGVRDLVLGPEFLEEFWLDTFPDAQVMRLEDAGHFVQEDAHERVVPALVRFAQRL